MKYFALKQNISYIFPVEKERYSTAFIAEDLADKMVFLGGARQVGKTTLARKLLPRHFPRFTYFNWDSREDRRQLLNFEIPGSSQLLIFDEIHKYSKWKTFIKGLYDKYNERFKFLVTGSARLNIYRKGGDSLLGRYYYYTLHPFTLAELMNRIPRVRPFEELDVPDRDFFDDLQTLDKFGGFPEIIIKQNERTLRRWHIERIERLFREDVRDLTSIRDLTSMQLLSDILPRRVGSLLSVNSLREDLEVSHRAVTSWLDVLESFYYHFRIYPFHLKTIRSMKKTPKLYLTDWSEVEDESARFENLVASHLLKFIHFLRENQGYKIQLNYLRSSDKKEVDFLISVEGKPWFSVEVKTRETRPAPSLLYFRERLKIPFNYQLVKMKGVDLLKDDVRIVSADRFLSALV